MTVVTGPLCEVCRGVSGHPPIEGDGFPVCAPCIYRIGRAANAPLDLTWAEVQLLDAMPGDVVRLRDCNAHGFCWEWDRSWPTTGCAA